MYGLATKSAEAMDEIDKGAQKVGISTTAYQEWSYVLGQNGADISKLETGMKTLLSSMDAAASGTASAQERFDALGISVKDANGNLKDQETMLNETLYALASMENGSEKARLATELFGKAGVELMPMLNNGSDEMAALTERAHELGLVMSEDAVSSGVLLGDTIDDAKQSFSAIISKIGVEFMPIVQQGLDWVIAHMPEIQVFVTEALSTIGTVLKELAPVIKVIFEIAGELWNTVLKPVLMGIVAFIKGIFTGDIKGAFQGLIDALAGIWAGLELILKIPLNAGIKLINKFIDGINKIKIPDWVPGIGGQGLTINKIPLLYNGGVLEKGQAGFIEGTGAEAVVPLHNNKKWISAVAQDMNSLLGGSSEDTQAILDKLDKNIALLEKISKMKLYLSTGELVGALVDPLDKELGHSVVIKQRTALA